MKSIRHNGKTVLMTILAIGCMALVLLWPQWRDEVRAAGLSERAGCLAQCVFLEGPPIFENVVQENCTAFCSSRATSCFASGGVSFSCLSGLVGGP